ncbi:hypothetical protein BDZ97DRAFT_1751761 [Flammula alnicola]|nr:hypothetical protein BDZ97DRAFT_1751761 [Flammula alnicola]
MGIPKPLAVIVDNCCQVRRYVREGLGDETAIVLDVYHFIMRYGAAIYGGTKNAHRREVLLDIRNAIIKSPAKPNQPATYWEQSQQETRIVEAYDKWVQRGGVWSAAASKVHADQLNHVRKGCLARPREDIAMDGSRIEGSHKGWNSIQRAQPSGIEIYTGLGHDFFLRRNIRIASSRIENQRPVNFHQFVASTYASHHIQLINYTAQLFNSLYEKEPPALKRKLDAYPTLPQVQVTEVIGLVESAHSITFGGFVEMKAEASDSDAGLIDDIDAQVAETDQTRFIRSLEVDEHLFSVRMAQSSLNIQASGLNISNTSSFNAPTAIASVSTGMPSQKRKDRATLDIADTNPNPSLSVDAIPPDSKRRRFTGALSPSALALGLSSSPPPEYEVLDETPEPQDFAADCTALLDCEPINSVVPSDIALPGTSSSTGGDVHALFRFQTTLDKSFSRPRTPGPASSTSGSQAAVTQQALPPRHLLEMLRRPLPLPSALRTKGLTRSQLLFSVGTSIDPRALQITGDDEFYLFMDMRAEFQWISFGMTASKWASAAKIFNDRLEVVGKKKNIEIIKKNPRALVDKLNAIEPKISDRILKGNYHSKKSNTDTFWTKHCVAVPALIKTETLSADGLSPKKRKGAVCTRCKAIMYTGNKNLNHRKGVCADGVAQKPRPGSESDLLPEWPQPQGVFSAGKSFNPAKFLSTVRDLYEKVMDHHAQSPNTAVEYTLEDEAFSRMIASRTTSIGDHTYFLLYDLEFTGSSSIGYFALNFTLFALTFTAPTAAI